MKMLITLLTCLFILSPNVLLSETMEKLVERNGLYYKPFTEVPFTGTITGRIRGSIQNGRKHGLWVFYYDNGRLSEKGTYKNGKKEGLWIWFKKDGPVLGPFTGNYKNDKLISD
jgi:hypothetical protein